MTRTKKTTGAALTTDRLEVVHLPVDELRANPWNPNRVPPETMHKLREYIRREGLVEPLVVRRLAGHYQILGGYHRWTICKDELGYTEVPCIVVDVDDKRARVLTVNLNELSGDPVPHLLAQLVHDLSLDTSLDDLSTMLPYSTAELRDLEELLKLAARAQPRGRCRGGGGGDVTRRKKQKRIQVETDRHLEAWRCYLSLGPDRTLKAVGQHFGVSHTTVRAWARSFGWDKRAAEHDAKAARKTLELAEAQGVDTDAKARARNLQLTQMALLTLARAISSGEIKAQMSDLPRLVQLERMITDGPEEKRGRHARADDDGPDLDSLGIEELWGLIRQEVEAINRLAEHDNEVRRLTAEGRIQPLPALVPLQRLDEAGADA